VTNTQRLIACTEAQRESFRRIPLIGRALAGHVTRELYIDFLTQAFHHVRHTVPLLMAVGARLPDRLHWLQVPIFQYIGEELGHDDWILGDLEALGVDPFAVRSGRPALPTDAMIAYAYDVVMRRDPIGFFGMVHVLEGTSSELALAVADSIERALNIPKGALTYLRSHGQLDQRHVGDFASILDRLDPTEDLPHVVGCAQAMFCLYGNIFRGLEEAHPAPSGELLRRSA
jgi:pyrroloquinoline quinone (PQQ) biosynthesis protein C